MARKSYSVSWSEEEEELLMVSSDSHAYTQRRRKAKDRRLASNPVAKCSTELRENVHTGDKSLDGVSGVVCACMCA